MDPHVLRSSPNPFRCGDRLLFIRYADVVALWYPVGCLIELQITTYSETMDNWSTRNTHCSINYFNRQYKPTLVRSMFRIS